MSIEPTIVAPRVSGRIDADVVGAECRRIFYTRLSGESITALAERAAQGRDAVVLLRYRDQHDATTQGNSNNR